MSFALFPSLKLSFAKFAGQQIVVPPPAFDLEESFTYAGGWEGTLENLTYDWNPADGEESLGSPDFTEQTFNYAAGWEGTLENITYDWNPVDGEESLGSPDLTEDFSTTTGGWEVS